MERNRAKQLREEKTWSQRQLAREAGLSDEGVFCESRLAKSKKQAILATGEWVLFVLDHSKIGQTQTGKAFVRFEELEKKGKNYCIVTDNNVPNEDRTSFEEIKGKFLKEKFISVPIS